MMINKLFKVFKDLKNFTSGFYIGEVVDNNDPLKIGRIKVKIENLNDKIEKENLPWTFQIFPIGTGENKKSVSTTIVPGIGTKVIVIFPTNDVYTSFYIGELLYKDYDFSELKEDYPETYGFQNKIGDKWYVNMKQETVDIFHHSKTKMHIRKDGTVDITGVKDININISGNANINVNKNANVNVNGNVTTKIGGNWKVNVGGTTDIISSGNMTLKAPILDLNP